MPRPAKHPRLWLRKATAKRNASWFILDCGRQISTRYAEADRDGAEKALAAYMERNYAKGWTPKPGADPPHLVYRGLIYFLTSDEVADFPIKIGYSTIASYKYRCSMLQIGCPYKLISLGTTLGTQRDEVDIQMNFWPLRLRGEWFRRGPDLLEFIQDLPKV
jgi:hypothetical protein